MQRLVLGAAGALLASVALAADVLHLYNWNNYISDATLDRHQRRVLSRVWTEIKVR